MVLVTILAWMASLVRCYVKKSWKLMSVCLTISAIAPFLFMNYECVTHGVNTEACVWVKSLLGLIVGFSVAVVPPYLFAFFMLMKEFGYKLGKLIDVRRS